MSPNGTSSSSICCCSRYFRRSSTQPPPTNQQNNAHLEPIEIKVNGQPHLMVPHVAIRPTPSVQSIPLPLAPDNLSEINLELFETARTSRTNDRLVHLYSRCILNVCSLIHRVYIEQIQKVWNSLQQTPPNGRTNSNDSNWRRTGSDATCRVDNSTK